MKTFADFITEGRDAPLYHGTEISNAWQAVKEDMLSAHVSDQDYRKAVSLTRNLNFARHWIELRYVPAGVVFELNQAKLAQNYTIKPYNYWDNPGAAEPNTPRVARFQSPNKYGATSGSATNEFEEYIAKDIKPLRRYLNKIIIYIYKGDQKLLIANCPPKYNLLFDHPLVEYRYK